MPTTPDNYPHTEQDALIAAALDRAQAEYAPEGDPQADAWAERADDRLAVAARDLVHAIDALPADQQPRDWIVSRKPKPLAGVPSAPRAERAPNGKWRARWREGRTTRQLGGFTSRHEALDYAVSLAAESRRQQH
ncbi:hypothetical protein [Streptacidiphilus albus]|uniref:hypothetical protein n=1 Tax=Streptacidiphilus albus TaxID=105425 RepID=UPI00054C4005|nr:hypothetical protein [Streptacidiphilus albus]